MLGASGLLLLRVSDWRLEGDRDRRSNREERFGSGSVWSNRERFEPLRSSSAILKRAEDGVYICLQVIPMS